MSFRRAFVERAYSARVVGSQGGVLLLLSQKLSDLCANTNHTNIGLGMSLGFNHDLVGCDKE